MARDEMDKTMAKETERERLAREGMYRPEFEGDACGVGMVAATDGQPSRRGAWHNSVVNDAWPNFYSSTKNTLERAYVRPRFRGYIAWQSAASAYLRGALLQRPVREIVRHLNDMHFNSIGSRER